MKFFNFALVGLGRIGFSLGLEKKRKFIWSHSKAIDKFKKFKLAYAVDKDIKKIKKFKRFYKTVDVRNNFNFKNNIDCIIFAINENQLFKTLKKVNLRKIRLIILEKPVARSITELNKIFNYLKKKNLNIIVNYQRRFDTNYNILKKIIKNNKFGKLQSINVRYSGGVFNIFSHMLDLIIMLTNKKPREVSFTSNNKKSDEFSASGYINFEKNIICTVNSISQNTHFVFDIYLIFDKALINISETNSSLTIYKLKKSKRFDGYKEFYLYERINNSNCDRLKEMYSHIEKLLSRKKNVNASGSTLEDTKIIIKTLCSIENSVKNSGKLISIN